MTVTVNDGKTHREVITTDVVLLHKQACSPQIKLDMSVLFIEFDIQMFPELVTKLYPMHYVSSFLLLFSLSNLF